MRNLGPSRPKAGIKRLRQSTASNRSFRAAAGRLGITPSAFSHTMRQLEERLGVHLLQLEGRTAPSLWAFADPRDAARGGGDDRAAQPCRSPVTRQITSPTSSATSTEPSGPIVT